MADTKIKFDTKRQIMDKLIKFTNLKSVHRQDLLFHLSEKYPIHLIEKDFIEYKRATLLVEQYTLDLQMYDINHPKKKK